LKHFNVLSMALVLLSGAWSIFFFRHQSRRFADSGLRHLLRYLIFFNLIELEVFVLIYFDSNLTPLQSESFFAWFKGIDWPLRTLLILGMFIFQYRMIAWLRGKKLSKWIIPSLFLFAAALVILFLLEMRFPGHMPRSRYISFWNLYVWPLNLLWMTWLVRLLLENRKGADPDRRRCNRAYAWFFLVRIPVPVALILLSPGEFNYWSITVSRLLILYTNLIPLLWFKYYFTPWAGSLGKIIGSRIDMEALQKKHGLSARELEILNLMIDGKSYKQMEESLFISIHTVKSHVYSLYRKMNVKNRHQLIHLISTSQLENS
jgi:DNA-binding CsgD family transcriptional regulator